MVVQVNGPEVELAVMDRVIYVEMAAPVVDAVLVVMAKTVNAVLVQLQVEMVAHKVVLTDPPSITQVEAEAA
jgi:hypothetical protein